MQILRIEVCDFRNLGLVQEAPHARFTVISGENGQGKTNLLEAVYYSLCLRPLRPTHGAELVRSGSGRASIQLLLSRGAVTETIEVSVTASGRELRLNGKAAVDLDRWFSGTAVVAFTPEDLSLVRGGPERRRRFLDRAVFTRWPLFLAESRDYHRLLRSRNRILAEGGPASVRESFEGPLARAGARVVTRRRAWLTEVAKPLAGAFDQIARIPHGLTTLYRGPPEGDEGRVEDWLRGELSRRAESDQERGFTSVGPHIDDLRFSFGNLDAHRFASQGQARALVLALKIAEIENLKEQLGFSPLLLLDDVSSELDPDRNRQLLDYLGSLSGQVLLTTTDPEPLLVRLGGRSALWRVTAGSVVAE